MYNIIMNEQKQFTAEYTPEAKQQLFELDIKNRTKIIEAIRTFEFIGINYKNLNNLSNGLFEIKPKDVRAYFMYDNTRKRIIIVGFITLKKTQKAPKLFMEQARRNIEKYLQNLEVSQCNIK